MFHLALFHLMRHTSITQRASYICNQSSDTDDFDINKYELSLIKEFVGQKTSAASGDSQSIVFDKHVCITAHYTLLSPWLPDLRISYNQADGSIKQVEKIDEFDESKAHTYPDVCFVVNEASSCVMIYTKHFTDFITEIKSWARRLIRWDTQECTPIDLVVDVYHSFEQHELRTLTLNFFIRGLPGKQYSDMKVTKYGRHLQQFSHDMNNIPRRLHETSEAQMLHHFQW
jgi:hypothetical protein